MLCLPKHVSSQYTYVYTTAFLDKFSLQNDFKAFKDYLLSTLDIDVDSEETLLIYNNEYPFSNKELGLDNTIQIDGIKNKLVNYLDEKGFEKYNFVFFNCWLYTLQKEKTRKNNTVKENNLYITDSVSRRLRKLVVISNTIYWSNVLTYCSFYNVEKRVFLLKRTFVENVVDTRVCDSTIDISKKNVQLIELEEDDILLINKSIKPEVSNVIILNVKRSSPPIDNSIEHLFYSFCTFYFTYILNGYYWCIRNNKSLHYCNNYDINEYYLLINRLINEQYYALYLYNIEEMESTMKPLFNNSLFQIFANFLPKIEGCNYFPMITAFNTFQSKQSRKIPETLGGFFTSNASINSIYLHSVNYKQDIYNYGNTIAFVKRRSKIVDDIYKKYELE